MATFTVEVNRGTPVHVAATDARSAAESVLKDYYHSADSLVSEPALSSNSHRFTGRDAEGFIAWIVFVRAGKTSRK